MKKIFAKIFQAISRKKRFSKNFSGAPQTFTNSKNSAVSSRGQGNFRGLEASRPKPRTSKCLLEDKDVLEEVPPGIKSGPGASSNMTDFRFCEVQNRRKKCCSLVRKMMWSLRKKKVFTEILMFFPVEIRCSPKIKKIKKRFLGFTCWFLSVISMGPLKPTAFLEPIGPLMGPLKSMGPGVIVPPLSAALPRGLHLW